MADLGGGGGGGGKGGAVAPPFGRWSALFSCAAGWMILTEILQLQCSGGSRGDPEVQRNPPFQQRP